MSDTYGENGIESSDCEGHLLTGVFAGEQGIEKKINIFLVPSESFSQQGHEPISAMLTHFVLAFFSSSMFLNLSKWIWTMLVVFFYDSFELACGCSCLTLNIS